MAARKKTKERHQPKVSIGKKHINQLDTTSTNARADVAHVMSLDLYMPSTNTDFDATYMFIVIVLFRLSLL